MDLDFPVPDDDPFGHGFDDATLLIFGQTRPAGVEVAGLSDDLFLRELRDLQDIDFGLESRKRIFELALPFGQWSVLHPEAGLVDRFRLVEVVEAVDFFPKLAALRFQGRDEIFLPLDDGVPGRQSPSDLVDGEEEALELLMEDGFQIIDRELVPAARADVLRGVRGHVHFLAAGAVGKA